MSGAALAADRSPAATIRRRLLGDRVAMASALLLAAIVLAVLGAPLIGAATGLDASTVNLFGRLKPPSAEHILGTDELGRDVLMRLLEGGRVSLAVGVMAALCGAVIGTVIGLVAGYFGGRVDALLMRLTDGVIALPLLPLLIVLAAVDPAKLGLDPGGPDAALPRLVAIIALVGWTTVARLVRSTTFSLRRRDFVMAAIVRGDRPAKVLFKEILPNTLAPILVAMTLSVGNVILLESVLSFLGLGIQPPTASWGNMLTNAQELVWTAPWLAICPGLAIFATVLSFNLLGDALQDATDPRAL